MSSEVRNLSSLSWSKLLSKMTRKSYVRLLVSLNKKRWEDKYSMKKNSMRVLKSSLARFIRQLLIYNQIRKAQKT